MFDSRKIGDKIGGLYEVREVLGGPGRSGMGEVYLCFYRWHQACYVLKTYQQRYGIFRAFRNAFHNEAQLWMRLGAHPHIVRAFWVHRLDGRIYIVMEHVPRDAQGRRTLSDHFREGAPLSLEKSLLWGIQFCRGMEHATDNGLSVHRDIKPDNLMIAPDGTLKITDLGLAKALDVDDATGGGVLGTLPWMAPEQFEGTDRCTIQSDVYSFGVVLYQMASGRLPFATEASTLASARDAFQRLHCTVPEPPIESPLYPVIHKCLSKAVPERYSNFSELREDLESLWRGHTGEPIPAAQVTPPLKTAREVNQQGVAMKHLGLPAEALVYHDEAINLDATFSNAWNDRGVALWDLERHTEALQCFEQAMTLDPTFVHPYCNKGYLLLEQDRCDEALLCFEVATQIDEEFPNAWSGKGHCLLRLRQWLDAAACFDHVLRINDHDCHAWFYKGVALLEQARETAVGNEYLTEAASCAEKAVDIDPFFTGAYALLSEIRRMTHNDTSNN
ncbi:MAG TPA: serine/threonine-protein kinase [Candidatus Hydrogenedentes bacterium]|nr:serine/threonine-protein kinase [Candidatus Hydrogenedentota bacterium]